MSILIYGAYGYTGELIARETVDRDLDVVLAGRNGTKTRGLGAMLGA
ncbi:MAG: saccharopine dehydrogenase, partial [Halovenus sp.]